MKYNRPIKKSLPFGITILFIFLTVIPMTLGNDVRTSKNEMLANNYKIDRYILPEFYDFYNINEIHDSVKYINKEYSGYDNIYPKIAINPDSSPQILDEPPMDSAWPMHGHDVRHTGRSPYSTVDTWEEIWKFETYGWAEGGPTINKDGTIYVGAYSLYAVYPNGTLMWKFDTIFTIRSAPAIDENGIIYFGIIKGEPNYLYAVYPNGTLKWRYSIGELNSIFSSPAIGEDGSIYFGSGGGNPPTGSIWALNPNGSLKWRYDTNHIVYSSPAIGLDGSIYCGSHDNHVYALYPNNGTLKWKYNTGSWVHGSPTIADDGTVYIGSDNGHLYAFHPNNGTLKWKINIGAIYGSPALDKDGIIYTGVWEKRFYAIHPNGTIKWSFNTSGGRIWGSSPALSDDDTLYFGTCNLESSGGIEIIALYTNCTVKWRKGLDTVFSSPAIGEDGAVYIGSCGSPGEGFLNAFGKSEANYPPDTPEIDIPSRWPVGVELCITFNSTDPDNNTIKYIIDWGDETINETNYYESGYTIEICHTWEKIGTYTIKVQAIDNYGEPSEWSEFKIEIPRNRATTYLWYQWFLECFPILQRLLNFIK